MNLLSSLALSAEMPEVTVASWRTLPWEASSTFWNSSPLSETLRRTSFSLSTSRRAARRSSELEARAMPESVQLHGGVGVFEVVALGNFPGGLVNGIADFLEV